MFSHLFKKRHSIEKKYLYFRGMNESSVCIFKLIIISLFGLVTILYPKISYAIPQDSLINSQNKKGWNVTPFPEIAYNSDLGFQYGIYCELYDFGNGENYPDYTHKFCIEAARFT